jgi:hypothetical protein
MLKITTKINLININICIYGKNYFLYNLFLNNAENMKDNENNINSLFLYLMGNNTVILETRYLLISVGDDSYSESEKAELNNILIKKKIFGKNISIRK